MRLLTAFGDNRPHNLSPAGQGGRQSVVLVERMTNPNGDHDNVTTPLPRTIFRYHGFGHPPHQTKSAGPQLCEQRQ